MVGYWRKDEIQWLNGIWYCFKQGEEWEEKLYLVRDAMQWLGHNTEERNLGNVIFGCIFDFISDLFLLYLISVLMQTPRSQTWDVKLGWYSGELTLRVSVRDIQVRLFH